VEDPRVLVVDIGTSGVRVSLVSLHQAVTVGGSARRYETVHPQSGWAELDPNEIWSAAQSAVSGVLDAGGCAPQGIVFSCMGDSLVPLDEAYRPLGNMIVAYDTRATEEARALPGLLGEVLLREVTSGGSVPMFVCNKIAWLRRNKPELFQKARHYFSILQYLLHNLGLPELIDYSLASRQTLFHTGRHAWCRELVDALGISLDMLGDGVVESAHIAGTLTHFGSVPLPGPTPVVVGAHDSECGLLGLGINPGGGTVFGNIAGTYDHVGLFSMHPIYDGAETGCGTLKDNYIIGRGSASGAYIEWIKRTIGARDASYDQLFEECTFDGRNSVAFIPNTDAGRGRLLGLNPAIPVERIFTAVVEGISYDFLHNLRLLAVGAGAPRALRAGGGGARSRAWLQLRADLCGIKVERVANPEVSTMGAAALAGVALNLYKGYPEAFSRLVRVEDSFMPDPENASRYQAAYQQYLRQIECEPKVREE
jgi:sugar (pentulose or hexulose) kinase